MDLCTGVNLMGRPAYVFKTASLAFDYSNLVMYVLLVQLLLNNNQNQLIKSNTFTRTWWQISLHQKVATLTSAQKQLN